MTPSRQRPNLYNSILQALLVLSILGFVLSSVWMFITSDACGVYVYGSLSIYSILNAVGLTLIQRWHRAGLFICLVAFAVECVSRFICGYPAPTGSNITSFINNLPFVIFACVFLLITIPIFALNGRSSNKSIWSEMSNGLDIKHSRHIYQLSSFLIITIVVLMCLYKPSVTQTLVVSEMEGKEAVLPREIRHSLLDSANVTLNEVVVIEGMIDSLPQNSQLTYNKRIFALKHILLSGLMTDKHNTLNLINISKIHSGDYSPEQQRILDWYISLPEAEQAIWLECPSVDNLSDFERELKKRISITKR